jgi:hypothetical protein
MSMTQSDIEYEEYMDQLREDWEAEYADQYRKEGEDNFINRRLASYFIQNPEMNELAKKRCEDAHALLDVNYDACTVLAYSAIEVGFKSLLLKPVIYGFVSSDHVADLVSTVIVSNKGEDKRLRKFITGLFTHMAGIDVDKFELLGQTHGLWGHIEVVQQKRNAIMHRAESVEREDAERALAIASLIVDRMFPMLRRKLRLLAGSH